MKFLGCLLAGVQNIWKINIVEISQLHILCFQSFSNVALCSFSFIFMWFTFFFLQTAQDEDSADLPPLMSVKVESKHILQTTISNAALKVSIE